LVKKEKSKNPRGPRQVKKEFADRGNGEESVGGNFARQGRTLKRGLR